MTHPFELPETLVGAPSLRAIKAFLAAARYRSFTSAASALHVTPAAVSKQIRELEDDLGTELFVRTGRNVTLTPDGEMFKDAAQLSLINIHQAAERLRKRIPARKSLVVCCSPAFSGLWLQPRISAFIEAHPDIELTVLVTQNFVAMEAGAEPDVYIAKQASLREGYDTEHLFDDEVYPVCAPRYLQERGPITEPGDLLHQSLLDISAYGRSQISEHIDWKVWLALHDVDFGWQTTPPRQSYTTNDYPALVQLAVDSQGIALGWHHLVTPLIEHGLLVRPLRQTTVMHNRGHYMSTRRDKTESAVCQRFCQWVREQLTAQGLTTKS